MQRQAESLPRSIMSATPYHWFEVDEKKHVAGATEEEAEENPFIIIERKGWPLISCRLFISTASY